MGVARMTAATVLLAAVAWVVSLFMVYLLDT
jgi:hypothetical protein